MKGIKTGAASIERIQDWDAQNPLNL